MSNDSKIYVADNRGMSESTIVFQLLQGGTSPVLPLLKSYTAPYVTNQAAGQALFKAENPNLEEPTFFNSRLVNILDQFKVEFNVFVANRFSYGFGDIADKVYSRGFFSRD